MVKMVECECAFLNQKYMEDLAEKIAKAESDLLSLGRTIKKLDTLKEMVSPGLKAQIFPDKIKNQIACTYYNYDLEGDCSAKIGVCIYRNI